MCGDEDRRSARLQKKLIQAVMIAKPCALFATYAVLFICELWSTGSLTLQADGAAPQQQRAAVPQQGVHKSRQQVLTFFRALLCSARRSEYFATLMCRRKCTKCSITA